MPAALKVKIGDQHAGRVGDPTLPQEVGHFIPAPASGQPNAQSNDVEVAADGLVYILDRYRGLDIVEYTP